MEHLQESAERKRQNTNPLLYDIGGQLQFDFSGGLEKATTEEELKPIIKKRNRRVNPVTYHAFLDEAKKIGSSNVYGMKNELLKHFNYKFGPHGKTPLRDMSDSQVIGTFYGHVRYAERIVEETK